MAEEQNKQPEAEDQAEPLEANPESAMSEGENVTEADPVEESELTAEELLVQMQEEAEAARDAALRAQADAQNIKRRAEQDIERARKFALEQFTRELLPVADNLERALESAAGDDDAIKPIAEGVELTLKSLLDAMKKSNIEVVDPLGEPFDPNLHQAMSMVENNDVEPNSVIAVMQKGYTLNGRLVRPAMVMVSKSGT